MLFLLAWTRPTAFSERSLRSPLPCVPIISVIVAVVRTAPDDPTGNHGRACSLDRSAAISAWTVSRSATAKPFANLGLTARSLSASTPV